MKIDVIIVAAGQGKRMGLGKNKLFLEIEGVPVLIHTLKVWEDIAAIRQVILVLQPNERETIAKWIQKHELKKVKKLVAGGLERQDSVYNGLIELQQSADTPDMVLIHDGARPFVTKEEIERVLIKTKEHKATVLAAPVKDTIKKVEASGKIAETLDRSVLWAMQTPQAFDFSLIVQAHRLGKEAGIVATDDAALVEKMGQPVYVVTGGYHNIKITTPEDILLAEYLIQRRGEQ